jgi:predicted amidohydrolase
LGGGSPFPERAVTLRAEALAATILSLHDLRWIREISQTPGLPQSSRPAADRSCSGPPLATEISHSQPNFPTLTTDLVSTPSSLHPMTTRPSTLQVSCVQLHWAKPLEWNLERTLHHIRAAAAEGSRVVVFPEANLTSYYFPTVIQQDPTEVAAALDRTCEAAAEEGLWVIAGTLRKTTDRYLNLAHVISPEGEIVHEYAKVHMAGNDEKQYCRGGDKLSLFEIDGIPCTLVICRDGRHPELYRLPAMLGARILFHPSCSSDELEAVTWKRTSGRAQQPVGPNSRIFHCVANTVGQSPDGKQTSSGQSFIREPGGLPLAEAGWYQEEMITAVLDIDRADRSYIVDSLQDPPFLREHWQRMLEAVRERASMTPE